MFMFFVEQSKNCNIFTISSAEINRKSKKRMKQVLSFTEVNTREKIREQLVKMLAVHGPKNIFLFYFSD